MRVVKKPEIRRAEILEAAAGLFFRKGFDATSVADIAAAAGVAKGGFYHYFATKDAALAALAERLAAERVAALDAALATSNGPADPVARINAFFAQAAKDKSQTPEAVREAFRALHRPENTLLRLRVSEATIRRGAPILAGLLAEAALAGAVDCPAPDRTADMILRLLLAVREGRAEGLASESPEARAAAAAAVGEGLALAAVMVSRLLRLPDGAVRFAPVA